MELVVKEVVPAKVYSNIGELNEYMLKIKEKYTGWIVTEDNIKDGENERAKLNKLSKNIADVRKNIEKQSRVDIDLILTSLKTSEKEIIELAKGIDVQIKNFQEKEWEIKQENISEIIDNVFRENTELKLYIVKNSKWKNKTFKLMDIETELLEQFEKLNKKYNFIIDQLNAINEEIENKVKYRDVEYLMSEEYDFIMKELVNKKNSIKETEDNIRRKAEKEAKRKLEEEQENNTSKRKNIIVEEVPLSNDSYEEIAQQTQEKQSMYISIKVSGLNKETTNALLNLIKKYNLKYVKEMR